MDKKAGLKAFSEGRRDILNIDPRVIEVEPGFNGRDFAIQENIDHVEWLTASIIKIGVKEPLTIRLKDGKIKLVGGECRLRAALAAIEKGHDVKTVPCQVEERGTNDASRLVEQVVRNTGKQFTPLELAGICKRLAAHGWQPSAIAEELSKSQSYIAHLFGLLEMPEEAQTMVKRGEVSAAVASQTINAEGDVDGVTVLKEAVAASKAAGKRKATGGRVRKAAAKRNPKPAARDERLSAADTEKVFKFFRWLLKSADTIKEARERADKVFTEITAV